MTHEHDDHKHDEHGHDDHRHSHDHASGTHHSPPQRDHDADPMTPYEVMEEALRLLMIEKGVLTDAEIVKQIDLLDSRSPALGAKVVARAWIDPAFKARLLSDCRAAVAELGIDIGTIAEFKVVENTRDVHNVVVCTLCSCYPKLLLGVPPAWYKSLAYRSRTVSDPRGVLAEFGLSVPKSRAIRVHDSSADLRYLVLPMRPTGSEHLDEIQLAGLVSRDCMIGTAVPKPSKH